MILQEADNDTCQHEHEHKSVGCTQPPAAEFNRGSHMDLFSPEGPSSDLHRSVLGTDWLALPLPDNLMQGT
jgi:hypothetical protein